MWTCRKTHVSEKHCVSIFRAHDGDGMFLRNVGVYLQAHMALKPIRPTSTMSLIVCFTILRGFRGRHVACLTCRRNRLPVTISMHNTKSNKMEMRPRGGTWFCNLAGKRLATPSITHTLCVRAIIILILMSEI
jgi:hypothetical protein